MFCLLARGQLLRGSEHLPPLRAGPPELGDSAVDRLRHPAHGVGVLLALPFQLPVLEPFVERSGVHELLVPLAHQRVEVVGGVLLPELAQHLLLVPLHGVSREERSARESCLMALIAAGVGSGSTGSSAAATGAGTGAAARSGATSTMDGGLGLLLPGGLPLRLFGAATGCAALSSRFSCRLPRLRFRFGGSSGLVHAFFSSDIFSTSGPSSSPVQVDAEAQAGAAQVDHVALVVGELEAEVPERDRAGCRGCPPP